jgi:hypothetical protein
MKSFDEILRESERLNEIGWKKKDPWAEYENDPDYQAAMDDVNEFLGTSKNGPGTKGFQILQYCKTNPEQTLTKAAKKLGVPEQEVIDVVISHLSDIPQGRDLSQVGLPTALKAMTDPSISRVADDHRKYLSKQLSQTNGGKGVNDQLGLPAPERPRREKDVSLEQWRNGNKKVTKDLAEWYEAVDGKNSKKNCSLSAERWEMHYNPKKTRQSLEKILWTVSEAGDARSTCDTLCQEEDIFMDTVGEYILREFKAAEESGKLKNMSGDSLLRYMGKNRPWKLDEFVPRFKQEYALKDTYCIFDDGNSWH